MSAQAATAMHWAAALVGLPYAPDGEGPHAFSCWGLVRWVFAQHLGIQMPVVNVRDDSADNTRAIRAAAVASGWAPAAAGRPAEWDIVLMMGIDGRHVGVLVLADRRLQLLHSIQGPGVCVQPLADLQRMGFSQIEHWRRREVRA